MEQSAVIIDSRSKYNYLEKILDMEKWFIRSQ